MKIWDVDTGEIIRSFSENTARVLSVAFNPNGRSFISGGGDGAIKIWSLLNKETTWAKVRVCVVASNTLLTNTRLLSFTQYLERNLTLINLDTQITGGLANLRTLVELHWFRLTQGSGY